MFNAILAFVVVLGTLVIVHELGHFIAAKILKMKVATFSIGFGPKIIGIRRGETDYIISAIPLGGYLQLSDDPSDESIKEQINPTSPYFSARPPFHKIILCLAGPTANIFLALILFIIIFSQGVSVPASMGREVNIGWITPGSPAINAGLRLGDRVIRINQTSITNWQELIELIPLYINKQVQMEVIRDQKVLSMLFTFGHKGELGIHPSEIIKIGSVLKGSPAETSGLSVGDRIIRINSQTVSSWSHFLYEFAETKADTVSLEIARGEQVLSINVRPELKNDKKMIGISFQPEEQFIKYSFMDALYKSWDKVKDTSVMTVVTLWRLITLDLSIKLMGGPIMIAQISGDAAKSGMISLLSLMAFLSIQIGIFNLIPFIPIVDGGQIMRFMIESIRKRPLSDRTVESLAKAGWAVMILFMVVVSYNDIIRLF